MFTFRTFLTADFVLQITAMPMLSRGAGTSL